MPTLTTLVVRGIDAYQRRLSPRKGYRCAHSVLHGGTGCSGAIRSAVAQRGALGAVAPAALRLASCAAAYRTLRAAAPGGVAVRGVCCCNGIPIPIPF